MFQDSNFLQRSLTMIHQNLNLPFGRCSMYKSTVKTPLVVSITMDMIIPKVILLRHHGKQNVLTLLTQICRDFWKFETKVVHCPEGAVHCGTLLRDGRGKLPGRPSGRERQCTDPWDPWGTSSFTSVDQGGPAAATGAQDGRSAPVKM